MPRARQIDVNPIGDRNYAVVVDGLLWCYAFHEARGMHGASYRIQYSQHDDPIKEKGSDVVLWSDKHWLSSQGCYGRPEMARRQAKHEGKYKTMQERIAEAVARLVQKKLVISPAEREQRREARDAITRRKREEFEAASRKRLDDKAHKIVRLFRRGRPEIDKDSGRYLGTLIVEAMEWARSNT